MFCARDEETNWTKFKYLKEIVRFFNIGGFIQTVVSFLRFLYNCNKCISLFIWIHFEYLKDDFVIYIIAWTFFKYRYLVL